MTESNSGNRYNTGPSVAVISGDLKGAWNDGVFVGDAELVEFAQIASQTSVEIKLFNTALNCGSDTPEGALASLAARNPGRTVVIEAPDDLLKRLSGFSEENDREADDTNEDKGNS